MGVPSWQHLNNGSVASHTLRICIIWTLVSSWAKKDLIDRLLPLNSTKHLILDDQMTVF